MRHTIATRRFTALLAATALLTGGLSLTGAFVGVAEAAGSGGSVNPATGINRYPTGQVADTSLATTIPGKQFPVGQGTVKVIVSRNGASSDTLPLVGAASVPVDPFSNDPTVSNEADQDVDLTRANPGLYDVTVKDAQTNADLGACTQCFTVFAYAPECNTFTGSGGVFTLKGANFPKTTLLGFVTTGGTADAGVTAVVDTAPTTPQPSDTAITYDINTDKAVGGTHTVVVSNTAGQTAQCSVTFTVPRGALFADAVPPPAAGVTTRSTLGENSDQVPFTVQGASGQPGLASDVTVSVSAAFNETNGVSATVTSADAQGMHVKLSATQAAATSLRSVTYTAKDGGFYNDKLGLKVNLNPGIDNSAAPGTKPTPASIGQGATDAPLTVTVPYNGTGPARMPTRLFDPNGVSIDVGKVPGLKFQFDKPGTLDNGTGYATQAIFKVTTIETQADGTVVRPKTGTYTLATRNKDGGVSPAGPANAAKNDGSCASCFTVTVGPRITSISPSNLSPGVPTTLTITGTGFHKRNTGGTNGLINAKVTFPADFTVGPPTIVDSSHITVSVTPNNSASVSVPVTVTNPVDYGSDTCVSCLTVNGLQVNTPSPNGALNQGTTPPIMITGGPFDASGNSVQLERSGFSPIVGTISAQSPTSITATFNLDLAAPGGWTPRVTTSPTGSNLSGFCQNCFTISGAAPSLTSITPNAAHAGARLDVQVVGNFFAKGTTISIDDPSDPFGLNGTPVTVLPGAVVPDRQHLTATISIDPAANTLAYTVTVINADGQQSPAGPVTFTVNPPPSADTVSPVSHAAGTVFTLTVTSSTPGSFNSVKRVDITGGGITTGLPVTASATSVNVPVTIAPGAALTARDVIVTNGDDTRANCAGCFTVVAAPTVTSISPVFISPGDSNKQFTIIGTNFSPTNNSLDFGPGVSVTGPATSVSSSSITVPLSATAGAAHGSRDVTVINNDATNGGSGILAKGLAVAVAPVAPTSLVAVAGNHLVHLTWVQTDDGGSKVTKWTVTTRTGGAAGAIAKTSDVAGTSADITGLTTGTAYTFTVTATNVVGTSPSSGPATATPSDVPGIPRSVSAVAGDTTASLSWLAPGSDGGSPITQYDVTVSPSAGTIAYTNPSDRTVTGATVTGLTNGTAYTFTVAATNRIGSSAAVTAGPITPNPALFSAPQSVVADPAPAAAQVVLTWAAPATSGRFPLKNYRVIVTAPTGAAAGSVAYPANRTQTGATVTGLTNGKAYGFAVVADDSTGAADGSGEGPASAVVNATPYTVPDAVTGLSGSAGNTVADLTWTAPAFNGGRPVTGYSAVLSPGNKVGTISGTTAHFTGLTNGTDYTATVFAVNARGNGPTATTGPLHPATVPTAPLNPSATPGNTQATVSWTAPADPGGLAITGYTVTSSPDGKTATAAGDATSAVVTGLTNGTSYTFTIVATNAKGNSPASAPTAAVTPDVPTPVVSNLSATASTGGTSDSTVTGKVDDAADTVALRATDGASGVVTGTATVDAAGNFTGSLDLSTLADGPITVTATATNTAARTGSATTSTTRDSASRFAPLAPVRILDTRSGTGAPRAAVPAMGGLNLQVTGAGGVPLSGVAAVVLNVTVTGPAAAGYVTAYPTGTTRPTVSNLNFTKGQTVPNLVVVPVGDGGRVTLFNGSKGTTQLLADVAGYFTTGSNVPAGAFGSLTPARLLDTRNGTGAFKSPVAANGVVSLQVAGQGGVPATGVSAVILNVTVTAAKTAGYLTAYPSGTTRPTASNLNFVTGQTVPNLVIVPVGADGKVTLFNGSRGTVQMLADIAGFYRAGTSSFAGAFTPVSPARVLDTRNGTGAPLGAIPGNGSIALQATGAGGVPTSGVSAVVLNVTVTAPVRAGYLTAYPEGTTQPVVSNLNFLTGQTVPNLVIVPVGSTGKVTLFNGSQGQVQVIADVAGYFS